MQILIVHTLLYVKLTNKQRLLGQTVWTFILSKISRASIFCWYMQIFMFHTFIANRYKKKLDKTSWTNSMSILIIHCPERPGFCCCWSPVSAKPLIILINFNFTPVARWVKDKVSQIWLVKKLCICIAHLTSFVTSFCHTPYRGQKSCFRRVGGEMV